MTTKELLYAVSTVWVVVTAVLVIFMQAGLTVGEPMVPPRTPSFTFAHRSEQIAAPAGMNPASPATRSASERSTGRQTRATGGIS